MTILIHSLIITLWCCGLFIITEEGQILYFLNRLAKKVKPSWLMKPVILCITCMSSVHGMFISILLNVDITTALISIFISAFLNTLVYNIYQNNL